MIMVGYGVLYPLWGLILQHLIPNDFDSVAIRFVLGGGLLVSTALSYSNRWVQKHLDQLCYFFLTLGYIHVYYMVWNLDFQIAYTLGGFVMIPLETICFLNTVSLMIYFAVVGVCVLLGLFLKPELSSFMFALSTLSLIPIGFYSVNTLIKGMTQVHKSKEDLLNLTAAVQSLFLPPKNEIQEEFFEIHSYYKAMDQCGGDWWMFHQPIVDKLRIDVGDVTGHGPGAAMMTASVASYFKILQTQKLSPEAVLRQVNLQMTEAETVNAPHLMTMLSLEFDFRRNLVTAYFAGCPAPVLLRKNGSLEFLSGTGSPLGSKDFNVGSLQETFSEGDRIIIFTDGVTEAKRKNVEFGQRRLKQTLEKTKEVSSKQTVQKLVGTVQSFVENEPLQDDLTIVVIEIKNTDSLKKAG